MFQQKLGIQHFSWNFWEFPGIYGQEFQWIPRIFWVILQGYEDDVPMSVKRNVTFCLSLVWWD